MAVFCKVVLLIAGFGSCVQSATLNYQPLRYTIPQPLIQAFSPKGLKVSIPHTAGIQLFAFHGNINKPLDRAEDGMLAEEVIEKEGEMWVYYNKTAKLRKGDIIYYRLFVVKNNLGYRMQNGVQEVKEVTMDKNWIDDGPEETTTKAPVFKESTCEKVISNLSGSLTNLQKENDALREENHILIDLVEKSSEKSTTLGIDGLNVTDVELPVIVQAIVSEKLNLMIKVQNVVKRKSGLVKFDVGSVEEKVQVVKAARSKLKYSKYRIVY